MSPGRADEAPVRSPRPVDGRHPATDVTAPPPRPTGFS
ncbi:hypothetical protein STRTUCAR8_08929 [Streptomyces turgidiscabies Car8]|uniref:Uncharacterized protein n=1 Tax=Streptomyces turgidiscabies (strain Car8) TaxID=698760 RepID=L7FHM5_STRT8|nr:hypothetical protein STRTUCAR8_08929 [Streptomyces turgidiscabies Car8]GAQ73135.1 hypothetical protein T45_04891 [Streptomyces turgidiscabies]